MINCVDKIVLIFIISSFISCDSTYKNKHEINKIKDTRNSSYENKYETNKIKDTIKKIVLEKMMSISYLNEETILNNSVMSIKKVDSISIEALNIFFIKEHYLNNRTQQINNLWMKDGYLSYKSDKKNGFYYEGYLPKSEFYIFTENSLVEHLNFANLILVNKFDTIFHRIISKYSDSTVMGLVESPNGIFLAYYENEKSILDEPPCHITVLKVNKKNRNRLMKYGYFVSNEFSISEMNWLNDSILLIKANNPYDEILFYQVFL